MIGPSGPDRRRTAALPALLAVVLAGGAPPAVEAPSPGGGLGPDPHSGAATTVAADSPWFEEVATKAGIDFRHVRALETRYWLPEIMSGGAAWLDYDGDGNLDLYLVQGGDLDPAAPDRPPNRLYRNTGDGRFEDVTRTAGVGDTTYGMGAACGDYDGDGDVDLYVTNVGPNRLYRNEGDGTFIDVTDEAGVGDDAWGTSAAFLDYDGDRDLDLFVTNYVNWSPQREIVCSSGARERDYCLPANYRSPAPDTLYRNDGHGRFEDVSESAGIRSAFGNGLGVVVADFDEDGWPDVYVANDGNPNQLWINGGNGRFTDEALFAGTAVNGAGTAEASMGVASVDIEDDGDQDIFITHLRDETDTLFLNEGGLFIDDTARLGLAAPSLPFTHFGVGFADFDHDGLRDLYMVSGRVGRGMTSIVDSEPFAEPNQLMIGERDGRFEEALPAGGTSRPLVENSRAAAFGDYDNDGDVDIAIVNNDGPLRLLRNIAGERGHWLMLRVVNRRGSDALGARVRVSAAGRTQWRSVETAYSYCSSHDPRVHFGLGSAERLEEAIVHWPGGARERFGPLAADRLHTLERGSGEALPAARPPR